MNITPRQKETLDFWLERHPELTAKDLDPSQNQWNSVRLEGIKHTPNFISIEPHYRFCRRCGTITVDYVVYYKSFGDSKGKNQSSHIRPNDDTLGHNGYSWVQHLSEFHPEVIEEKLSSMKGKRKN